jgi:hypothetical protein
MAAPSSSVAGSLRSIYVRLNASSLTSASEITSRHQPEPQVLMLRVSHEITPKALKRNIKTYDSGYRPS